MPNTLTVSAPTAAEPAQATQGVPKRRLGSTGEMVSMLGLGGSHIGQKDLSDAEAISLMREAVEGGITFFDNCWDYNGGASAVLARLSQLVECIEGRFQRTDAGAAILHDRLENAD